MKIIEVKIKIASCYEVANQIEEIMHMDEFAAKVRGAVADIVDETTSHGDIDAHDMTIEVGEDDVRVLYDDGSETKADGR